MGWLSKTLGSIIDSIIEAKKDETEAYDSPATVLRDDGDILWVHIPGGVDETPIKKTIDAKRGDVIQVRVGGGTAWATGNQTAPPTDDTKAKEADSKAKDANIIAKLAKKTADQAGKTATNYLSWSQEYGLIVSEDATEDPTEMEGGNTRIISDGMEVYKGQTLLAHFGREIALYSNAGVPLAYFGYSRGPSGTGNFAQYYTLGVRQGNAEKYSVALGYMTEASGQRSQAQNHGTIAASWDQTAIGSYNKRDSTGKYAFIIGNGENENARSDALTVDWHGFVTHAGDGTDNIIGNITRRSGATVTSCTATMYGKVCQLVLGLTGSSSIASGENVFEGTLGPATGYEPKAYVSGVGYYGARAIVGRILPSGDIVVRNASASAVTLSDGVYISFTYIMNI